MSPQGRIHVLGLGNLGRLFAHALANTAPNPPAITLLLHRSGLHMDWEEVGRRIEITTNGKPNSHGAFDIEDISSSSVLAEAKNEDEKIENLIITTKTIKTLEAIQSVKGRLGRESTIIFCQNGMGTVEEVTTEVFPDAQTRPEFLAAITSHGVYSTAPFRSVHAGLASVTIGRVGGGIRDLSAKTNYFLSQIVNAKILNATEVDPQELLYLQLEKLAVNAILNPLTALFRCKNGEVFTPDKIQIARLANLLLDEVSRVFQSLPEVEGDRGRFEKEKLEIKVREVAQKTAGNTSSMLQDVLAGRETEIEFINGWIVRKGRQFSVKIETNEKVVDLVKRRSTLQIEDVRTYFPDVERKADLKR